MNTGASPLQQGKSLLWTGYFSLFLGISPKTFVCPSLTPTMKNGSGDLCEQDLADANGNLSYTGYGYAYDTAGSGVFARGVNHAERLTDSSATTSSEVRFPAKMYAFTDTKYVVNGAVSGRYRFKYKKYNGTSDVGNPDARHNRSLNMTFVDGHCENIRIADPENPHVDLGSDYKNVEWTGWDPVRTGRRR